MPQLWDCLTSLHPRRSFRVRLGLTISSILLFCFLLLAAIVGHISETQVRHDEGKFMEQLARQMTASLDQGLYGYFQEIQALALLDAVREPDQPLAGKRVLLNKLRQAYPDYAWIGLTNINGTVVASTNQLLEGKSVAQREWFIQGKIQPKVLDVHSAKLLARLLPNPSRTGEPLRFLDVVTPVADATGHRVGVLGAHLYWQWAENLRDDILQPFQASHRVEIIILARDGKVLLAPHLAKSVDSGPDTSAAVPSETADNWGQLGSFQAAQQRASGYLVEVWPDRVAYLTGYAKTAGFRSYSGLGWTVLVRQPTAEAFAVARWLQWEILIWGVVIGVLAGAMTAWAAGQLVKPLVQIAIAAERIRLGDTTMQIPLLEGHDELALLSRAVFRLFLSLDQQNRLLQAFNEDLEARVVSRTETLNALNQTLNLEIAERKQAELALQQANTELQRLSWLDGLTGIANRRRFDEYLQLEWQRSLREECPISLLLLDVDHFKLYNDCYGHQAGDRCLQQVALALTKSTKRSTDLVARYGGEEFAIVLPNTDAKGAVQVGEQVCLAVRSVQIPHQKSLVSTVVTVSIGVATIVPTLSHAVSELVAQADAHLYTAKAAGRNQVASFRGGAS